MRNLYTANGFLEAKVDAATDDNYKGRKGDLAIQFNIQEGKQTRVASLKLEGVHAFKEDELLGDWRPHRDSRIRISTWPRIAT